MNSMGERGLELSGLGQGNWWTLSNTVRGLRVT